MTVSGLRRSHSEDEWIEERVTVRVRGGRREGGGGSGVG